MSDKNQPFEVTMFVPKIGPVFVVYFMIFRCIIQDLAARGRTPWRISRTTWLLPPKYTRRLENTTWCRRHHIVFRTSWCRTWTCREIYTYQTCIHVATWFTPRAIFSNRDGNGCFLLGCQVVLYANYTCRDKSKYENCGLTRHGLFFHSRRILEFSSLFSSMRWRFLAPREVYKCNPFETSMRRGIWVNKVIPKGICLE